MNRLQTRYNKEIIPKLKDEFQIKNVMAVPKIKKVVVNVGVGKALKDQKFLDSAYHTLERITGQKPVKTLAKKSISNFKVRKGSVIGVKVTLRGKRMYDFFDKLVNITIPRVRDFRGIPTSSVDGQGNLNIGIKEHIVFPEIKSDEIESIHSLEVTVVTSAGSRKQGIALLKYFGFPFQKEESAKKLKNK